MQSVAEAVRAVVARVPRLPAIEVALLDAPGRILAEDVVATRALPGFDNSAMDGFAVRAGELPARLPLAGVVAAGDRPDALAPSTTARIFTGAPMPPGADAVVIQEDAHEAHGIVELPAARRGDHVRRAGEDLAIGDVVFRAGHRLRPWDLAVLAALGRAHVRVAARPRVALLATGNELVDVTTPPGFGELVASTRYALSALVRELGGEPVDLGLVRDDPQAIARAIAQGATCDALITTGGVSVGDRDHVHAAYATAGITLELYKVAMKPGKPFSFGTSRTGAPTFGLPGNPISSLVAFELFVRPALLAMQGATLTERARVTATLAAPYRKQPGRTHYLRARLDDHRVAHAHPKQGSAMLSSLVDCTALVELPAASGDLPAGAAVTALLLDP